MRAIGAIDVGMAALRLGAGRQTKDDTIDHAVGIRCLKKRGDAVAAGEVLAEVHARDDASAQQAGAEVLAAYEFGDEAPPRPADRARDDRLAMPELPEVETTRRQLEPHLVGRRFDRVEIHDPRLVRPFEPTPSPRSSKASECRRSNAVASI